MNRVQRRAIGFGGRVNVEPYQFIAPRYVRRHANAIDASAGNTRRVRKARARIARLAGAY